MRVLKFLITIWIITSANSKRISKLQNDKRNYRSLVLQNELKVILVSDPDTKKAAASLCVPAGSMSDPPEFPGLAHFIEHMLFMGNKKYPKENSYENFIVNNGGIDGAWTGMDATNYFFQVSPKSLAKALDRFQAMFEFPVFKESALEREVKAVDSEFEKCIPDDQLRRSMVKRSTGKKGHPFTQFDIGSLETLWKTPKSKGLDLRGAVVDFFDKHYSSNLMHLVVLGTQGMNKLQSMVEQRFGSILNKNRTKPIWTEHYLSQNELQERIDIIPIGESRHLQLIFPIEYKEQSYKTDPVEYLNHMLNITGNGSLAAFLQQKQLITALKVPTESFDTTTRGFATFELNVELTKSGILEIDRIVQYFFEYIKMLTDLGPQEWIWDEIRTVNMVRFMFQDKPTTLTFIQTISTNSIDYPTEKILFAHEVDEYATFDKSGIQRLLRKITPENCRLIVTSKQRKNTTMQCKEKYFGVEYNRNKIDAEIIKKWKNCKLNPAFFLPQRNDFIPLNFDLKMKDEETLKNPLVPRVLMETDFTKMWYLQETEFSLPKAITIAEFRSPLAIGDPFSTTMNILWSALITRSLWEFQYAANIAGFTINIEQITSGAKLTFSGYNEKLSNFILKIVEKIVNFSTNLALFETVKETTIDQLKNSKDKEPSDLIVWQLNVLLTEGIWNTDELLQVIKDATLEKLYTFVKEYLSNMNTMWIFYGNLNAQESLEIVQKCESLFAIKRTRALFPSQMTPSRIVELPPGKSKTSDNSIGLDSPKESVLTRVLSRLMKTPCYDRLRTKEQLGYRVGTSIFIDEDSFTISLKIYVQGNSHPDFMESRIDKFLLDFEKTLKTMTNKEFLKHAGIKSTRTLLSRSNKLYNEIYTGRHNFNRERVENAALKKLSIKHLKSFFREKVSNPLTRRRLVIQMISVAEGGAGRSLSLANSFIESEHIIHPNKWKQSMNFFSASNPINV